MDDHHRQNHPMSGLSPNETFDNRRIMAGLGPLLPFATTPNFVSHNPKADLLAADSVPKHEPYAARINRTAMCKAAELHGEN
ncbi:MAG: hypothetical protein JKY94_15735 [Rhodobacteraceae bacterium]|nr:hypothetical protein [Paracoccaceae bacterium]